MLIVAVPWWAWLIYLPLLATYRLTLWTCVLLARLLIAFAKRAAAATRKARA